MIISTNFLDTCASDNYVSSMDFNKGSIICVFIGILLTVPVYLLNASELILDLREVRMQMEAGAILADYSY